MVIRFTQYLLPDGRKRRTEIDRPDEIEQKAHEMMQAGCRFESEVLTTGLVHMDCLRPDEDKKPYANVVVQNGENIPEDVDRLVNMAYEKFQEECDQ